MLKMCGSLVVSLSANRSARLTLMVVAMLGLGLWPPSVVPGGSALAQERGATPANSGNNTPTDTEAATDAGGDGPGSPARGNSSESVLSSVAHTSTPILVVTILIALMSFYLIALVVWMAIHYRAEMAIPPGLVTDVQNLLEQNKFNEAYHRVAEDTSFLARVLAGGVRKLPSGMMLAQRAMEMANEDVTMEMEHRTTYLATVGTLGPMIGLVGTVYGMIMAFQVIAVEGSSPQASQLAAGISTALYATLEGIAISIPAIFFYALCRNRIARLSLEVGMTAEPLLEQFAPGVRPVAAASNSTNSYAPPANTPAPQVHTHPFALTATLAATGSHAPRPALPPAEPS